MDFDKANELAESACRDKGGESYRQLVSMCVPYLISVKYRFGFWIIPDHEVRDELVADAVGDALVVKGVRNLPFTICLQNTFRDLCRHRVRSLRVQSTKDITKLCDMRYPPPRVIGTGPKRPSAEILVERGEEKELFRKELESHEPFSKKLIVQRMRGSTMPEMARIFEIDYEHCRAVYWHDINVIRAKVSQYGEVD